MALLSFAWSALMMVGVTAITANATGLELDQAFQRVNGVALFVGAAIAWFSATGAGRHRKAQAYPGFAWHRLQR